MSIVADRQAVVIPAGEWAIDPVWSSLEFEVKKLGLMTVKGRAPGFTGTIHGGEKPVIEGTVDLVEHHDLRRDPRRAPAVARLLRHQRYPELRFESTSVESRGDELIVDGNLTSRGSRGPCSSPARTWAPPATRGGTSESASSSQVPSIARNSGSTGTHHFRAVASSSRTTSSSGRTSQRSRLPDDAHPRGLRKPSRPVVQLGGRTCCSRAHTGRSRGRAVRAAW